VRLVPLGQTTGLRHSRGWNPSSFARPDTQQATLDESGRCAFRSDLAAMRHETQYTRLFRSWTSFSQRPAAVGVGGPVGTGKTALMDALLQTFRARYDIAAITNDISPRKTPSS